MKKHKFNIFPEMVQDDYSRLKNDLMNNGFDTKTPIYLYEGEILDGWNRYKACQELDIFPEYVDFEGTDTEAINFVMRTNKRRNLTSWQWACVAVEAEEIVKVIKAEARERQKRKPADFVPEQIQEQKESAEVIADIFNTNQKYVIDAGKLKESDSELFQKSLSGETSYSEVKKKKKDEKFKENQESFLKEITETKELDIKIYNGDCNVFMKETPVKYDLILTDPPYAMDFKSGWNDWDKVENDKREDTINLLHESFKNMLEVMKDDAHIYVFGNPYEIENIKPIFEKFFILKNILIWNRQVIGMGDLETYGRAYDVVYFGYKKTWKKLNGTRDKDILDFSRVSPNNLTHPTEKPLDMLEYLIKKSSNEGDYILDPFAGSFSTIKASRKLNRNCHGCELDKQYIGDI